MHVAFFRNAIQWLQLQHPPVDAANCHWLLWAVECDMCSINGLSTHAAPKSAMCACIFMRELVARACANPGTSPYSFGCLDATVVLGIET